MKTSLIILLVVFLLVGCSSKENSAYVATVTALSDEVIANLEEQNQLLLDENSTLEEQPVEEPEIEWQTVLQAGKWRLQKRNGEPE